MVTALLVHKVNKVELPQSPLKAYVDEGIFKVYLSDVGLLACAGGIRYKDILPETDNIYKGMLTENYVIQELAAKGICPYYYKPDASMEIDVLLDFEGDIVPAKIFQRQTMCEWCRCMLCLRFWQTDPDELM